MGVLGNIASYIMRQYFQLDSVVDKRWGPARGVTAYPPHHCLLSDTQRLLFKSASQPFCPLNLDDACKRQAEKHSPYHVGPTYI